MGKPSSITTRVTGASLDLIAYLEALPSMQQISISGLHEDHFEAWSFDHLSTDTELRIEDYSLDMDKVAALLKGPSALQDFYYDTPNRGSLKHKLDPMTLCRTLAKNAGTSLESCTSLSTISGA